MQSSNVTTFPNRQSAGSTPPPNPWIEDWKSGHAAITFHARATALDQDVVRPHTDTMSTITREELDAKLATNVAEVKAISAETKAEVTAMRSENKAEMTAMRAENAAMAAKIDAQFAALSASINAIGSKIDGVEKGVEGKIDGLKTSMSTMQWVLATLIAIAGLAAAIVPLLKGDAPVTPTPQPQVIVVQPASTVGPPAVPTPTK